jgi:hypothetical protein
MVTVHRDGGLRFAIFKDDHDPAHVHVSGSGEAKVNLIGPLGYPIVEWSIGLTKGDLRPCCESSLNDKPSSWRARLISMAESPRLTDAALDAAAEHGRFEMDTKPRATSARYDPEADRIVIDLINGCTLLVSPVIVQDMQDATPDQLADIEVSPTGLSLHWPQINVDVSVASLLANIFGTAKFMDVQRRNGHHALQLDTVVSDADPRSTLVRS